jgi:hypothetical protein
MRVLVCGGRDYDDWATFCSVMEDVKPTFIIEGRAKGADTMAWKWARHNLGKGSEFSVSFKANWGKHGKAAGPIRNRQMLEEGKPDLVVAFKGGKGTANMVKQAKSAGVEVLEVTK